MLLQRWSILTQKVFWHFPKPHCFFIVLHKAILYYFWFLINYFTIFVILNIHWFRRFCFTSHWLSIVKLWKVVLITTQYIYVKIFNINTFSWFCRLQSISTSFMTIILFTLWATPITSPLTTSPSLFASWSLKFNLNIIWCYWYSSKNRIISCKVLKTHI